MIRSKLPPTVYADYQASTPLDQRIANNLTIYFSEQLGNPHANDHAMGWAAAEKLEAAYRRVASALRCDADEIIFTSGATEANNLAVIGLACAAPTSRKRILVSAAEHKSVLAAADAARRYGCTVELIPVDARGAVRPDKLAERLDDDVLLVSVMAVNNEIGTRQPLSQIVELSKAVGAVVHTDASQALADRELHLDGLGVHALSLSGHKIYGPQGIGVCFVRRDVQARVAPLLVGGGQQGGLRAGTVPVALCRAFADSVDMMVGSAAATERKRIAGIRNRFAAEMLACPGVELNGPPLEERHPGNCNLRFTGCDGKDILTRLQPRLAAATGSSCTSGVTEPSHVLTAIGLSLSEAESSIRFSFGRYSTEQDVDVAIELLKVVLTDIGLIQLVA